ncbi:MAG: hypothetical protein CO189_11090 [candidate division Zixibacteria bacterium CG_4_9_14_3_um_filter_46_8]|nr:MAG: hypothetical protein CO189_11090 [candidate division Zixibacteria bacterium CG_4_9_14_3_um_filter_46_8]
MKTKFLAILMASILVWGVEGSALASAPIYLVEVRSNPAQPFDFTGHKHFGEVYPVLGDQWNETVNVNGFNVSLQFAVESMSETVVCPAGTFYNCAKFRMRIYFWPLYDETVYWYNAEGVGRVKFTSSSGETLLQDYHIVGGYGYDPVAVGNWWQNSNGGRSAVVAYEAHLGYPCFRIENSDQSSISWAHVTGVPEPTLPEVYIEMIPAIFPVSTPPGGSFSFTGSIGNSTALPRTSDVWIMLEVPGYGTFGPLQRFNNIPLGPYTALVAAGATQPVPSYAPLGTYNYIAYCGDYPSTIIDDASFEFTVTAGKTGDADNWNLLGWFNDNSEIPTQLALLANYPNPFNASTEIRYSLPAEAKVRLEVFNLLGQKVATLIDGVQVAGQHSIVWDAASMSSGAYFYSLTTDINTITRKMVLVK